MSKFRASGAVSHASAAPAVPVSRPPENPT
jgi:hypothetical protein